MTSPTRSTWRAAIARWFEIDVRSLAALRIGMALVMLWDLAFRGTQFIEFYTDQGAAPRVLFSSGPVAAIRSLYFISGKPWFAAMLFAVHAIFSVMLLVGFRTQLAVVGCLVMNLSLVNRNVMMTHSGDGLLLWLLVWSIFLPMGAAASVDRRTSGWAPKAVCSLASAAMLLQILLVYTGSVASKTLPEWRSEFSAVYYFLNSHLGTPLGHAVGKYTFVCTFLTITTMVLEALGPLVALVSAGVPWLRTAIVALFIFFHMCLGATLYVGTFAYICAVAWLTYIPGATWDAILSWRSGGTLAKLWSRFITAISATFSRAVSWAAVRTICWPHGVFAHAIVFCLLLYVVFVNLRADLPTSIGRRLGTLNRLPQAKQVWGVMTDPPHMSTRLTLKAHLADGRTQTLMESGASWPDDLSVYFWSPWNAREMKYRQEIMMRASNGAPDFVDAMCAYLQRRWDAVHPPQQHIRAIDASCAYEEVVSIDLASFVEPGRNEQLIHTWVAPSPRKAAQ